MSKICPSRRAMVCSTARAPPAPPAPSSPSSQDDSPAYNLEDINAAVAKMLKQRPQETMEDETAVLNRTNRRGNVATKNATRNRPRFTENVNTFLKVG